MSDGVIELTDASFATTVEESDVPVLVDFWAPWCAPCLMVAPMLKEIANEYEGRLRVCRMNVDDHREVAIHFQIRGIPTLMLFKGGELVERVVGVPRDKSQLTNKIDSHLS